MKGLNARTWVLSAFAAGAACVAAPALADDHLVFLGTSMFGEYEVGHKGADESAGGDFSAEIDMEAGRMCYALDLYGIDDFAAAHIHKGAEGKNGPPVVTLELPGEDGEDKCVDVDVEVLKDIAENQDDYYVNVHTAAIPQGAVRGQLGNS